MRVPCADRCVRVGALSVGLFVAVSRAQTLTDSALQVEQVAGGLSAPYTAYTTAMVFVDADTLLAVNRDDGVVVRVDLMDGQVVGPGSAVLDLDIISAQASDSQTEYGVQGMTTHPDFDSNGYIYIRYDKSPTPGVDTDQADVVDGPNFSASDPTANVIERYVWDPAGNGGIGTLSFDSVIHTITMDTRYHHGGGIVFGADGTLYTIVGDLRRDSNEGWKLDTAGPLLSTNWDGTGVIEDMAVVLRMNDDGSVPVDNPFDTQVKGVPVGAERWFAYGVRNSFGLAIDPVTGDLWDTQNGEDRYDEINRVAAGSNLGWADLMGPENHAQQMGDTMSLYVVPGSSYADPAYAWHQPIGATGIAFCHASALGPAYDDMVLAGGIVTGHLWGLRLNGQRDGFAFSHAGLQDNVDDRASTFTDPVGTEVEEIYLGDGFGGIFSGVLAITIGPDGLPYVLTGDGRLFRIEPAEPLPASAFGLNIAAGTLLSGGVAETTTSDDAYVRIEGALNGSGLKYLTRTIVKMTSPHATVSRLDVTVETGCNDSLTGMPFQKIFLWNWNTSSFVRIDQGPQPKPDTVYVIADVESPANFVHPDSGEIRVRVFDVVPLTKAPAGLENRIDHVEVIVTP